MLCTVGQLHPLLKWRPVSTWVWVPCLAFSVLRLVCDLCLRQKGLGYSRMSSELPCHSLPVSTPSGIHLLISVLCCYTNFRCLGVFLVFIFGLISFCFSLCASKKISQTEIGNICFALGAALRILLRTFEVKYPLTVNK